MALGPSSALWTYSSPSLAEYKDAETGMEEIQILQNFEGRTLTDTRGAEGRGAEGQGALAEEPVDVVRAPGTRGGLLSNETGSIAKHWSSGWESRDVDDGHVVQ